MLNFGQHVCAPSPALLYRRHNLSVIGWYAKNLFRCSNHCSVSAVCKQRACLCSRQRRYAGFDLARSSPAEALRLCGPYRSGSFGDNAGQRIYRLRSDPFDIHFPRWAGFCPALASDASGRNARLLRKGEWLRRRRLSESGGSTPWRLRQAWGEYRRDKWRILGGQAWSLLRANQKGISSDKDLIDIDVIDPAYHVGLLGDRKRQVQIVRELPSGWLAAASYEEGGNFVAKAVLDRARVHLEGLAFARRDGAWGAATAAVIHATERVSLLTQQFASDGAGREAVGGLPNGVRSYATIQGAEVRLPHELKLFAYAGLVYGARSGGNRVVGEWTVGGKKNLFTYSTIGVASLAAHYSHVQRALWSGPTGEMNYAMVGLRFTVPAP